jgi:hypothetical protein
MGIFNATATYKRGFQPTEAPDQFTIRIFTGGFAGAKEADARAVKEIGGFRDKQGYASSGVIDRRRSMAPSYFEYTVQFSHEAAAPAAPALAPSVEAPAWMPTHLVPAAGMAFWDAPHPSRPTAGQVPGNTELSVDATAGDWAQVRAGNGWQGWVDGRLLVARS